MPLRRIVSELPEAVSELCLVRFGLIALRFSSIPVVRGLARNVNHAAMNAIETKAGLLGSERISFGWRHVGFLQYWASFDSLDVWSRKAPHSEWWRAAVNRMRTKGDLGLYHEAYLVPRANVESIYVDCAGIGLANFGTISEPVGARTTARDRLGRRPNG